MLCARMQVPVSMKRELEVGRQASMYYHRNRFRYAIINRKSFVEWMYRVLMMIILQDF